MKRAVTLVLLPVFVFSIIGWQWMFVLRLYTHQVEEWSTSAVNEKLEIVSLTDGTHGGETYLLNDHEIFHHGEYLDIKYKVRKGDEVIYYCHHDNDEKDLFKSYDNKIKDTSDMTSSNDHVQKVVKLSVFDNSIEDLLFDQKEKTDLIFLHTTTSIVSSYTNPVFVPPDAEVQIS